MIKSKKILLVGHFSESSKIYTYPKSFLKVLLRQGYQIKIFNYRKKIPFLLDLELIRLFRRFNPDLVFFIKAEKIAWQTVRHLKKTLTATIVNFYPDNPFVFWNGNSNSNILQALPYFDHFLIWSEQLIPIISAAGARNVVYFPFAFDEELFLGASEIKTDDLVRYQSDVCFVGSWDESRQWWLEELIEKMPNLNLAIWGDRWQENLSKNSKLKMCTKGNAIYENEMVKAFRASKIVLNFIRKQNLVAHNMRTFEIPASKAFMLTQYTDEQSRLFNNDLESFKDLDELIDKIRFFLTNEDVRLEKSLKCFDVAKKYSLNHQLEIFLNKMVF